jgi:phage FluMu protein Com
MAKIQASQIADVYRVYYTDNLFEIVPSLQGASYFTRAGQLVSVGSLGTNATSVVKDLSWQDYGAFADITAANAGVSWPVPTGEAWLARLADGSIATAIGGDSVFLVSAGGGLTLSATKTANFTATVGNEYPIDGALIADPGVLVITPPVSTTAGDQFAIFDSTGLASLTRTFRCTFTGQLLHGVSGDYAEINSPSSKIIFTFYSASFGWKATVEQ